MKPKIAQRDSSAVTADSTFIGQVVFPAQTTWISRVDDLWQDDSNLLPEQVSKSHAEQRAKREDIKNRGVFPGNKCVSSLRY